MPAPETVTFSGEPNGSTPHVSVIPSAGMGHLLPFFRFIVAFSSHGLDISVVTVLPTVSAAEADHFAGFFDNHPRIRLIDFNLLPLDSSAFPGADPFLLRWEATRRSAHLLCPLIGGAKPRVSAVVTDVTMASHVIPISKDLHLPCHILFTSGAIMLAYFPTYLGANAGYGIGNVDVPDVYRIPKSSIPQAQALHDPNHVFTRQFIENDRVLAKADDVPVNTFDALEPEAVTALRQGSVAPGFPPVFDVGPLNPVSFPAGQASRESGDYSAWLDMQPARSVVYVSFGSCKAILTDQLRELAAGLEASGHRFLWVVKGTVVDRNDAADLGEQIGAGFLERVQGSRVPNFGHFAHSRNLSHSVKKKFALIEFPALACTVPTGPKAHHPP